VSESQTKQTNTGWLVSLYDELKRRRVIRTATLYVVMLWPIIQVVDILSPTLALPDSAIRYLVMGFATGLPLVLLAAWLFDLNQRGIVRDHGDSHSAETDEGLLGPRTELAIILLLLIIVAGLFYIQLQLEESSASSVAVSSLPTALDGVESKVREPISSNRVAVLPFESFSEDANDRFFAEGLAEELLNVLAGVPGLQVAARTSSFAYRGVRKSVQQIGHELQVDVILEGSVRRNDIDNTIRVTAQLIDVRDGAHLWSQAYDRQFSDLFKIQDEIAAAVAKALQITLFGVGSVNRQLRASASPEAMILYSMGQTELDRRNETGLKDAVRFFQRALDLDPGYIAAWVGLADASALQVSYGFESRAQTPGQPDLLAVAQAAVDKGLQLDSESGMVWASQGLIYRIKSDDEAAREALLKAIGYSPNYAMAHMWYAPLLANVDAQLAEFETAFKLDPRSSVAGYNVANLYLDLGRDAEAMEVFASIVDANPNYAPAYQLSARISRSRGRIVDAIRQSEKAYELSSSAQVAFELAELHLSLGNYTEANTWVSIAKPIDKPENTLRYDWLEVQRHAMQGDLDQVQQALQRMVQPSEPDYERSLIASYAAYLMGNPQTAIDYWRQAQKLGEQHPQKMRPVDLQQFARLGAIHAYQQLGQVELATDLLVALKADLDEAVASAVRANPDVWYRHALANQLAGQQRPALISLQRAIDEGWVAFWQARIEPILQPVSVEPDFQAMMAGLQTRIHLSRGQYELEQSFAARPATSGSGSE